MTILETRYRTRLGQFILISNLVFIGLIFVFYLLKGFDDEEFAEMMKLIAPIKSVYLTALVRYVVVNRNVIENSQDTTKVNKLFTSTSFIIITVHISSLIIATSLYALFNVGDFEDLRNIIIGIETFFGVYVGLIIASMFKAEKEENA